jgi:hypothetical protein
MKPVGGIRGLFGYPRPSLAHALTKFERESAPGRDEAADAFGYVLGGETFNLRSLDSAMLFWLGRLITREFLLRHIPADCDQIIEIGGGRGTNLFHLWLAGAPPNAEYCCLEPAEEARQKARHFASLASLRFTDGPIDLAELDLRPFLRGKRAFVFTCSVAVVVQPLPDDIFRRLTCDKAIVGGAHIEPGAWQIAEPTTENLAQREYVRRYKRNENFFPLLKRAEQEGIIRITEFVEDAWGDGLAPHSLIAWTPV